MYDERIEVEAALCSLLPWTDPVEARSSAGVDGGEERRVRADVVERGQADGLQLLALFPVQHHVLDEALSAPLAPPAEKRRCSYLLLAVHVVVARLRQQALDRELPLHHQLLAAQHEALDDALHHRSAHGREQGGVLHELHEDDGGGGGGGGGGPGSERVRCSGAGPAPARAAAGRCRVGRRTTARSPCRTAAPVAARASMDRRCRTRCGTSPASRRTPAPGTRACHTVSTQ